jgi:hypothetical protein
MRRLIDQLVEEFPALYGTRNSTTVFTGTCSARAQTCPHTYTSYCKQEFRLLGRRRVDRCKLTDVTEQHVSIFRVGE